MRIRRMVLATLIAVMLLMVLAGPALAQEAPGRGDRNNNDNACSGRRRRACEIPEVPVAAAIPAIGLLAVAGYVIVDRRRHRKAGAPTA